MLSDSILTSTNCLSSCNTYILFCDTITEYLEYRLLLYVSSVRVYHSVHSVHITGANTVLEVQNTTNIFPNGTSFSNQIRLLKKFNG